MRRWEGRAECAIPAGDPAVARVEVDRRVASHRSMVGDVPRRRSVFLAMQSTLFSLLNYAWRIAYANCNFGWECESGQKRARCPRISLPTKRASNFRTRQIFTQTARAIGSPITRSTPESVAHGSVIGRTTLASTPLRARISCRYTTSGSPVVRAFGLVP